MTVKSRLMTGVIGLSMLVAASGCGTATGAAVGAGSGAAIGAGTGYGAGKGAHAFFILGELGRCATIAHAPVIENVGTIGDRHGGANILFD